MRRNVWILSGVAIAAVFCLDLFLKNKGDTSLLLVLLFWSALVQGAVALVAAAELSAGKWLGSLRDLLLTMAPLLTLFPAAFLIFGSDLSAYAWHKHPNAWLSPGFFVIRNVVMLSLTAIVGILFARACKTNATSKNTLAVMYLFAFVTTQSLVAFDWVMSFAHPWISTMFAPMFFVESLICGVALTVVIAAICTKRQTEFPKKIMRDAATMLFGFSLFWAGLSFAQFLTIWYGNIPEEVSYLYYRVAQPVYRPMAVFTLLGFFLIPFPVMISARVRSSPVGVVLMAVLILSAYFVEKILYLAPVSELTPCVGDGTGTGVGSSHFVLDNRQHS